MIIASKQSSEGTRGWVSEWVRALLQTDPLSLSFFLILSPPPPHSPFLFQRLRPSVSPWLYLLKKTNKNKQNKRKRVKHWGDPARKTPLTKVQVEAVGSVGRPQPQGVDGVVAVAGDRGVVRHCQHDLHSITFSLLWTEWLRSLVHLLPPSQTHSTHQRWIRTLTHTNPWTHAYLRARSTLTHARNACKSIFKK